MESYQGQRELLGLALDAGGRLCLAVVGAGFGHEGELAGRRLERVAPGGRRKFGVVNEAAFLQDGPVVPEGLLEAFLIALPGKCVGHGAARRLCDHEERVACMAGIAPGRHHRAAQADQRRVHACGGGDVFIFLEMPVVRKDQVGHQGGFVHVGRETDDERYPGERLLDGLGARQGVAGVGAGNEQRLHRAFRGGVDHLGQTCQEVFGKWV